MQPNETHSILLDAKVLKDAEIMLFPYKTYQHPLWGEINVTREKAESFKKNFDNQVRGQEIATDYAHGDDKAKGEKASGWYRSLEVKDDGLWAKVELTPTAAKEVADGEWRYFSPSYLDSWKHPETGEVHENVLIGGGLTNIPFQKGIAPINFTEIWSEVAPEEHSDEPGNPPPQDPIAPPAPMYPAEPDPTVPVGSVALTYVIKGNSVSSSSNGGIHLSSYGTYTGNTTQPWHWQNVPPNGIPGFTWIPPTLTKDGGDNSMEEKELRELLGLDDDADITAHLTELKKDAELFRELDEQDAKAKKFAEDYPDEAKTLAELREYRQEKAAKSFAESFKTGENGKGLPPAAIELVEDAAKSLSGVGQEKLGAILNKVLETGLVDYKQHGSSYQPDVLPPVEGAKNELMEKVKELKEKDNLTTADALREIAKTDPELVSAWRTEVPQR